MTTLTSTSGPESLDAEAGRPLSQAAQDSDYGSDFSQEEEDIVNQLLRDLGDDPVVATNSAEVHADQHQISARSSAQNNAPQIISYGTAKMPAPIHGARPHGSDAYQPPLGSSHDGVSYPDLSRALAGFEVEAIQASVPAPGKPPTNNSRSPLERFRSFPRKPLTVSDLSSGAWCEMQYWYTLTRLPGGKKTRTPAMQGGSKVHQTLEDQVHTTIQVRVAVKEEAFALRIWNLIQGLRTLRDTGMTRELEVWGTLYGEVTNGVIDEVSYTCPNLAFEEELHAQSSQGEAASGSKPQPSIATYFQPHRRIVYLTDIKTRASTRLPSGAALRPARVQLFLYHRLLSDMASGKTDYSAVIARYGLNSQARFSDAFMAQIGDLHDEVFDGADSDSQDSPSTPRSPRYGPDVGYPGSDGPSQESLASDLIRYRSIEQLIPLLQAEIRETFPQGANTIGDLLAVQYRHRDDGRIIGNNSFPNDPEALDGYLKRNLEWWRGSRRAEGVPIEETYKCRSCEFVEICEWRKGKEAEIIRKRQETAPE